MCLTYVKPPSVEPPPVNKQRYLGVTLDNRLNWSSHVSKVCGVAVAYYLSLITYYAKSLPSPIVKMLIESLILSRCTYALSVWGLAISKDSLCQVNRLQNRAVHLVCGLQKYDYVSQCRAGHEETTRT